MSWVSILPPLIVLIVGFFTKRITLSLFIGVVVAAAIASNFSPIEMISLIEGRLISNAGLDKVFSIDTFAYADNFFIIVFVLSLGILIEIIMHSHAATAFVEFIQGSIKNRKSVETTISILL